MGAGGTGLHGRVTSDAEGAIGKGDAFDGAIEAADSIARLVVNRLPASFQLRRVLALDIEGFIRAARCA